MEMLLRGFLKFLLVFLLVVNLTQAQGFFGKSFGFDYDGFFRSLQLGGIADIFRRVNFGFSGLGKQISDGTLTNNNINNNNSARPTTGKTLEELIYKKEEPKVEENPFLSSSEEVKELDKKLESEAEINKRIETLSQDLPISNSSATNTLQTTDACSNQGSAQANANCRLGLQQNCSYALYAGLQLASECQSINRQDIVNGANNLYYQQQSGNINSPFLANQNPYLNNWGNVTQSGSFNTDRTPMTLQEQQQQRQFIEPNQTTANVIRPGDVNLDVRVLDGGWIEGWATLFAINGGAPEAGQRMNKLTAFGFDPYSPTSCLISLPYKTVDRFFGTTIDECVKRRDGACLARDKAKVKAAPIEIVMLKNGKRTIEPLGDLGPAEWTRNAIDLTRCVGNKLGATGKDMVRFRPAPKTAN